MLYNSINIWTKINVLCVYITYWIYEIKIVVRFVKFCSATLTMVVYKSCGANAAVCPNNNNVAYSQLKP